jgi:hypothetical protein
MPNYVQYSTSNLTGSLRKNNVALGIVTSSIAGPTSTTGWYTGINPASGKYVIYKTAVSGDPDIFTPQTNQELFNFVLMQGGSPSNITSVSASLDWIATQSNLLAANLEYPNIITNGLKIHLDAGFVGSYPTTASTWYDISGNASNGTLTNGPTYNSANSGSIVFDGGDDFVSLPSQTAIFSNSSFTVSLWMYPQDLTGDNMMIFATYGPGPDFNSKAVVIRLQPDNVVLFAFYNDDLSSTGTFTYNVWQNLVCTYNYATDTSSIYINGNLIGTGANGPCIETVSMTVRIGNWFNQEFYLGNISLFSLYNRSLSQTEIIQNYSASKGRYGL